jgi:hypothetical protein
MKTGQPDRTDWEVEPWQNKEDNQYMTGQVGQQRQESCGQDCWGRTTGTGQLGRDSQDGMARTGQPGQDSWDRTAREDRREDLSRTGNRGQDCQNRIARTGQLG